MRNKLKNIFSRKTRYYIESLIYILSIIIVVLANVFGPIWIRMLPLLFILGVIGKIVFDRPVITTIFGSIVSICVIYLNGVSNILENIIESGIFTLYIALGELFGSKARIIYEYLINGKDKRDKYFIKNFIVAVVLVLVCVLFHNYTNSNIFMYNLCKDKLENYLSSNYSSEKFEIIYAKYNFNGENNFKFNVEDSNENIYRFIVYLDNKLDIYDGYRENKKSKEELQIKNILDIHLDGKYDSIYKKVNKISEGYELGLTKQVKNINDSEILNFSKEVVEIIELILKNNELENIISIDLSLLDKSDETRSKISTVYINGYKKNKKEGIQKDYTYIMKSLDIEYID